MSFNILEAVNGIFTPEVISKAGFFLNEKETQVSRALNGIVPAVLKGIIMRSSSTEGANAISLLAQEQYNNPIAENIDDFLGEKAGGFLNNGSRLLHKLFGDKVDILAQHVSDYAGIGISSSVSLVTITTSATLNCIGKYASANQLNAAKLAETLQQCQGIVVKAIPQGFNLNGTFTATENIARPEIPVTQHYYDASQTPVNINEAAEKAVHSLRWILPLLLLTLIATFLFTCKH